MYLERHSYPEDITSSFVNLIRPHHQQDTTSSPNTSNDDDEYNAVSYLMLTVPVTVRRTPPTAFYAELQAIKLQHCKNDV